MIHHANGPHIKEVTREQAIAALKSHREFPEDADFDIWPMDGRWVAAWHQAAPADADEEAPGPKSEGPDDEDPIPPDSENGIPKDDDSEDNEDKDLPKPDDKDKEEKTDVKLDHEILTLLHKIVDGLGLNMEDNPMGPEEPAPAPPGPSGPPGPHPGPQSVNHIKSLKPGEAQTGTTPVGAPAFSSIADDHPWKSVIGKVASFTVEEKIPDNHSLSSVDKELRKLAHGTNLKVKQITEGRDDEGHRIARALISAY